MFFALLCLALASAAFSLAYTVSFSWDSVPPLLLLRLWPDYSRTMAEREPDKEEEWLSRLLRLEPHDSEARLQLAALVEWQGDLPRALTLFEQAATHDARYRAQWALLGFQSRHPGLSPEPTLWATARRCFRMSHGDRHPLLETVWQLRPDAAFLLEQVIPDLPPVLYATTAFLMKQGDLSGARAAFFRLVALPASSPSRANAGLVATLAERAHLGLDLTDLHLDRQDPASAVAVWRSLVHGGLVEVDGAAAAGSEVTNARFLTEPLGRGFDWRVQAAPGLEMRRVDDGWRVDFGSHPPESAVLLFQRVTFAGLPVPEVSSNAPDWVTAKLVDERTGQELRAPLAAGRVARLRIEYRRPRGTPPLREPFVIRQVRWKAN